MATLRSIESELWGCPEEFKHFEKRFMTSDLFLDDDEAREPFHLETGLPSELRTPVLEELITRDYVGNVCALRIFIGNVGEFFETTSQDQTEVLKFCFSRGMMETMGRLNGNYHFAPPSNELQTFLVKCFSGGACTPPPMEGEGKSWFKRLFEKGIIVQGEDSLVKFTSPWAVRYYFPFLFPIRGYPNPSSLGKLVRKAIGSMSAKVLKESTMDENGFPQQATLEHQFMEGLARWTAPTCSICPELSSVFPLRHVGTVNATAVDFYLDLGGESNCSPTVTRMARKCRKRDMLYFQQQITLSSSS
ncbi:hypothetical protein P3T76_011631 [Phytophthora citrophthora]|uniref:Uncharacterized protein n=1 Tax=Phytophthora citrophthora TaxID=4793 RepID=A0AAD9G8Q4_9STRA|nr:hypothetical protein P3T76_011631 [Phytophthora citrophthora]